MNFKYLNEENKYKIYEDGKVFSVKTNKFLNPVYSKTTNVLSISLVVNNKNKKYVLHTLIYKLFIGNINNDCYISFKDNNIFNLNINNLIMLSRRLNKEKILFDENEWKYIPNYENRYIINKEGLIKSLITNKILENNYILNFEQSYISVKLIDNNGNRKQYYVHRLVYLTFKGEIYENMVIDHIDQNKFNNKLENLRMISFSENSKNCNRIYNNKYTSSELLNDNFVNIGNKYKNIDLSNYEINECGQVRNISSKIIKTYKNKLYNRICLTEKNGKKYSIYIHQLVATLFIKNPNNYPFVNHIDENRENNCIFNLEWITNKQNITHSQGKGVSQYTLDDIFIKNYNSVNDAFRELNKVYGANIKLVCEGKRKTAFGYKWKWI
jgi:hypothetical protein